MSAFAPDEPYRVTWSGRVEVNLPLAMKSPAVLRVIKLAHDIVELTKASNEMGMKRDYPTCPTCGAPRGKHCVRANGKSTHTHRERRKKFLRRKLSP